MATDYIVYFKIFMTYVSWWLIPLIILFILKWRLGKYPIDVTIYEKRGEHIIKTNDVAGRFNNPVVCYKLKCNKDSIPIPEYDWVLQCMYKPTNLFEKMANLLAGKIGSITLFKYGSKQYKPIHVKMADGSVVKKFKEVIGKDGKPVIITVYEPVNVRKSMNKLDFEVIDWDDMNHMTQELRAIAVRRSPVQDFLARHGPLIAIIIALLALIIGGYYYVDLMKDGASKYGGMAGINNQPQNQNTNVNKGANVPIVGDLFAPGT